MEQQIKLAAKIYKCRDTAKTLFGNKYPEKIDFYVQLIKNYMRVNGVDETEAVFGLYNLVKNTEYEGHAIMCITAAYAEILEPSSPPSILV